MKMTGKEVSKEASKIMRRRQHYLEAFPATSKYEPHQGHKECARRKDKIK